jgi:hypothetical protein
MINLFEIQEFPFFKQKHFQSFPWKIVSCTLRVFSDFEWKIIDFVEGWRTDNELHVFSYSRFIVHEYCVGFHLKLKNCQKFWNLMCNLHVLCIFQRIFFINHPSINFLGTMDSPRKSSEFIILFWLNLQFCIELWSHQLKFVCFVLSAGFCKSRQWPWWVYTLGRYTRDFTVRS